MDIDSSRNILAQMDDTIKQAANQIPMGKTRSLTNTNSTTDGETGGGGGSDAIGSSLDEEQDHLSNKATSTTTTTTFSHRWSSTVKQYSHTPILVVLRPMARISAQNPKRTITAIIVLSLFLIITGLLTNFNVDVDPDLMWTPKNSNPIQQLQYITDVFATTPRYFVLFFHANGANVLNAKSIRRTFTALETVTNHPMYEPICSESGTATDQTGTNRTCDIYGVTRFWRNNSTMFEAALRNDTSERFLHKEIAKRTFADQFPVIHEEIFGFLEYNSTYASSAASFYMIISFPEDKRTEVAELEMVQDVLALNDRWNKEDDFFRVEVLAEGSINEELIRAINKDIPLVPIIFVAMALFTSLVFARRNIVFSRASLGAAAVVSVFLSILSGFGLLFIIGTPFTPITQLLPFLMFGIGLDDDFVIMGSYLRMDPNTDIVKRIDDTVNDIGISIFLTTLTTAIAFALGCTSWIPAVYWLCQYCFPTIVIVFIYQMTFFVACIALDERRIQAGKCDILCCVKSSQAGQSDTQNEHCADRFMEWFGRQIVRPWAKLVIVIVFSGLFGVSVYNTTKMTQQFKITDVLPRVSYAADFLHAQETYQNTTLLGVQLVFRDVNQSDPMVRMEMKNYINDLISMDFAARTRTEAFWMSLFDFYTVFNKEAQGKSFNEQLDLFLANPFNKAAVAPDIARDETTGDIIASRVRVKFSVDLNNVQDQINLLNKQRQVTLQQPVNQGREDDLAFFAVDKIFTIFEFYVRSIKELVSSTIIGVVSVTLVALLFIPHWSAALFVCPLTCILYIDLLGVMKWGGLHINSMTFIALTMSIGLIVDFVMHVLFRYYEVPGNRVEKTIEMLRTIGSSVLLGGVTTFLGVLPLVFASSDAFRIIFVSFLGIVTLGVSHGLILLPVILSTIGPEDQVSMSGYTSNDSSAPNKGVGDQALVKQEDYSEAQVDTTNSHFSGDRQEQYDYSARLVSLESKESKC